MADSAVDSLRGLVLSATELRNMNPDWTPEMIEDYLTLFENFASMAVIIDEKQNVLRTVVNVDFADSPFLVNDVDQQYVIDTDFGDVLIILNKGVDGRTYRMTNVGSSGNKAEIVPIFGETLFGSTDENLYDAETLDMTFETEEGWW